MLYIVDTNVLVRFSQRTDTLNPLVRTVIEQLHNEGHQLLTTVQNCIEFWNVATRPTKYNGFGITIAECNESLRQIEDIFTVAPSSQTIYYTWRSLVINYEVSGVKVHDAHLVAVMLVHGVERILTFNDQDFRRYEPAGIQPIHPQTILPAE
jgi:predicted nucleic acid-binding protein